MRPYTFPPLCVLLPSFEEKKILFCTFFPVHNTQFFLLSHTLFLSSFKIATVAAGRHSWGIRRPLINFTAGGKALWLECFVHDICTRCFDPVRQPEPGRSRTGSWPSTKPQAAELRCWLPDLLFASFSSLLSFLANWDREQGNTTSLGASRSRDPERKMQPGSTFLIRYQDINLE